MSDLDVHPTRPPLPFLDTVGHWSVGIAIAAAVIAAIGVVPWFAVPGARGSRLIVRL
jgi:hypothetical protein